MNNLKERLLTRKIVNPTNRQVEYGEIKQELLKCWLMNAEKEILKKAQTEVPAKSFIEKGRQQVVKDRITQEYSIQFDAYWNNNINQNIITQFDYLYNHIKSKLCDRHPWLEKETQSSTSNLSLIDNFLSLHLKSMLFESLDNKDTLLSATTEQSSKTSRSWSSILIKPDTTFSWTPIDDRLLANDIQSYPLTDPSFYDLRPLPTFLRDPFNKSPMRYDIYRIIKKNYNDKFQPVTLSNGITSTKFAPLHHTELEKLSPLEWSNFETILINLGDEDSPKWVLLNKKEGKWTLYAPDFLQKDCEALKRQITDLNTCTIVEIKHNPNTVYSKTIDWHAVLLSRVLPWSQLKSNTQTVDDYRSNIPIELLLQNTIESSCLTAPGHVNVVAKSKKAFAHRYPLSTSNVQQLYSARDLVSNCIFSNVPETLASNVIKALDDQQIICNLTNNILELNILEQFEETMKLAYYYNSINELYINVELDQSYEKKWFACNLNLQTIRTPLGEKYNYIHACAARNRFLAKFEPHYLTEDNEITLRLNAWINTGEYIYKFLSKTTVQDLNQSKNIAEMGIEGLDSLFTYLDKLQDPANLSCTLNLDSGQSCETKDYIANLTRKIDTYTKPPLFEKLSLVLPRNISSSETEFNSLILLLNKRAIIDKSDKIDEVIFENPDVLTVEFLTQLTTFVHTNKICLQIQIPEWNNTAFDINKAPKIALYRKLQNTILQNIRDTKQAELITNTKTISEPPLIISPLNSETPQVIAQEWGTAKFKLASSAGVQQQAQQEVAQEAQQEAQQKSQPKVPVKKAIKEYTADENALLTRGSPNVSNDIFSSCVGSKKDASGIIKKMDSKAYEHIKKYESLFKFGIDWEHTPGFRLYYSKHDKALILTYDETVEQDDIKVQLDNAQTGNSDPFDIQINDRTPPTEFCGDYRQLEVLSGTDSDPDDKLTLWHHVATETPQTKIAEWLKTNDSTSTTSEALQNSNVNPNQAVKKSKSKEEMLKIMKSWSKLDDKDELLTELFNEANLTEQNLRAFGQLFYHYDAKGNELWLALVHKIHINFPDKFTIYKERLLDPLSDWSECLEKTEVEALTTSMEKLKTHPDHQDILWKLIDAHGKSVGRMRFAEVWTAYETVIDYINANELSINKDQFIAAIEKYGDNFNATQFLRRLNEVLHHTGNRQDSENVQNNILEHLGNIDWNENGFYYACIHEDYRYWDESLKFEKLEKYDASPDASYTSTWDIDDLKNITEPVTYTLRYAAQKLKLNKAEFDEFKDIIQKVNEECGENNIEVMRLMLASLALGIDNIDSLKKLKLEDFSNTDYKVPLQQINKQLLLDKKELESKSYHVKMLDIPLVLTAHKDYAMPLTLENINACGRALQRYHANEKKTKLDLLIRASSNDFRNPIFTDYLWLIDETITENIDENEELTKFYKQLKSIDFSKSTKFPTKVELADILKRIISKEARQKAVQELIAQGCYITNQDDDFRRVSEEEARMINDIFLSKPFKEQNLLLLRELFNKLAIKQDGNTNQKIKDLLTLFTEIDKKIYYDELGQVLGLLLEQSKDGKLYSVEQLTTWLKAVFDKNEFKTKPYPVGLIKELITAALKDPNSSLINTNLTKLKVEEEYIEHLKVIMGNINRLNLSDQAKKTLAKCAITYKSESKEELENICKKFEKIFTNLKTSHQVTDSLSSYITQKLVYPEELLTNLEMLENLTLNCQCLEIQKLWDKNQIKLVDGLKASKIHPTVVTELAKIQNPLVKTILIAAAGEQDDIGLINSVKNKLLLLETNRPNQLIILAKYYNTSGTKPTLSELNTLIQNSSNDADKLIDKFKRNKAESKRYYSIKPEDHTSIKRVLTGFKLKQDNKISHKEQERLLSLLYYMNRYSLAMNLKDKSYHELLSIIHINKKDKSDEAKARVLACMREIVLIESGKWPKHTQMIDLLYGAIYNDDSLMHQVRTGEGKSLISLMRVAYRALNGQTLEVYSSKESLSARDHEEFGKVLDAFNIPNSYITKGSTRDEYHDKGGANGVGAVHYATTSGFALFLSDLHWQNKYHSDYINIHANNRAAILDESDAIFNQTTLNQLPIQTGANSVYNYDAWVYKVAYDYYLKNKDKFVSQNFELIEEPDLKGLYDLIIDKAKTVAPKESKFIKTYLATGDKELRNQKLSQLINATHLAQGMTEGVDYCVMTEEKKISESVTLETRFAKVMIEKQICHGSNFSELVHQALHLRLNIEAVKKSETPNFFIEPDSEIALSLNTSYILKYFYKIIEAFTGTAGDKHDVEFNKKEFKIKRVIKVPTHADVKTEFLPPIYCGGKKDGENLSTEEQIESDNKEHLKAILEFIKRDPNRPILFTCRDDKQVKALGELIKAELSTNPTAYENRNIIIDTNDNGLTETVSLAKAGQSGYISFTSRGGRGLDIGLENKEEGLRVGRLYATDPKTAKQEYGRQGRNGDGGECQDIINYGEIERDLEKVEDEEDFKSILKAETDHLNKKLKKHYEAPKQNKKIWKEMREDEAGELQAKYLKTRALQNYNEKISKKSKERIRAKEKLLIEGSALVMDKMHKLNSSESAALRKDWLVCRKAIETSWTTDESGQASNDILSTFYTEQGITAEAEAIAQEIAVVEASDVAVHDVEQIPIEELILFHQTWLKSLATPPIFNPNIEVVEALYGAEGQEIKNLYLRFSKLNQEQLKIIKTTIEQHKIKCHTISCKAWVTAIDSILTYQDISENFELRIQKFFESEIKTAQTANEVKTLDEKFIKAIEGAPDIEFLNIIIQKLPITDKQYLLDKVNHFPRELVDLCNNYMNQEDIRFFLNQLDKFKLNNTDLKYFKTHFQELKKHPEAIRQLIPLLLARKDNAILDNLEYNNRTAGLLCFLHKRPYFNEEEFRDLMEKINRIDKDEDKLTFVSMLSKIPPYISLSSVLNDLLEHPGMYGFNAGNTDLENCIDKIILSAQIFNKCLFQYGLIYNIDSFNNPSNEQEYNQLLRIYTNFPFELIDLRNEFFILTKDLGPIDVNRLYQLSIICCQNKNITVLRKELLQNSTRNSETVTSLSSKVPTFFHSNSPSPKSVPTKKPHM